MEDFVLEDNGGFSGVRFIGDDDKKEMGLANEGDTKVYYGVCTAIAIVGPLPGFKGVMKDTIYFRFDLDIPELGEKREVWKEFNATLGKSSNLKKTIENWLGEDLTEEEQKKFRLGTLLGRQAKVKVQRFAGKGFIGVVGVRPSDKEIEAGNELLAYHYKDDKNYNKLAKFIKDRIEKDGFKKKVEDNSANGMPW